MSPQKFVEHFREAFGEAVPLPIALWYGDTAVAANSRVPRCMVGAIRKVCNGDSLTLTTENVQCGGGGLYTAFRSMPDRVPLFVSETEHYKRTPDMVREYVAGLDLEITDKPYLNFVRIDRLDTWNGVEAVVFFATPDVLSGLSLGHTTTTMRRMPWLLNLHPVVLLSCRLLQSRTVEVADVAFSECSTLQHGCLCRKMN